MNLNLIYKIFTAKCPLKLFFNQISVIGNDKINIDIEFILIKNIIDKD